MHKKMFPDSKVASEIKMARTKQSYDIIFGLGPFFQNLLRQKIALSKSYSVSFDESFNEVLQKSQMDLYSVLVTYSILVSSRCAYMLII